MTHDSRRITMILRSAATPQRTWNDAQDAPSRLIFVRVLTLLKYALANAVTEFERDVDRVVLDHSVTEAEFLDVLTSLPPGYQGDVVMIRTGDGGFLSTAGRGGDRVLYALTSRDLQFYFGAHELTGREPMIAAA